MYYLQVVETVNRIHSYPRRQIKVKSYLNILCDRKMASEHLEVSANLTRAFKLTLQLLCRVPAP